MVLIAFFVYITLHMSTENSKALASAADTLKERQDTAFARQDEKVQQSINGFKGALDEHIKMVNEKLSKAATKTDLDLVKREVATVHKQVKSLSTASIQGEINKTAVAQGGEVDVVNRTLRPCKWATEQADGWATPRVMDGKEIKPVVLSINQQKDGVLVYDTLTHGKYIITPDCIWSTYQASR